MKQLIKVFLVCLLFSSCKNASVDYNKEIAKALRYYQTEDIDNQKFEAVKFLADNMAGHFSMSFVGQKQYMKEIDRLYGDKPYHIRKILYDVPVSMGYVTAEKSDLEEISAEYLIGHVDYWFEVWRTAPWLSELSFDDFLEYLLPYRFWGEHLQQDEYLLFRENIDTLINLSRNYEWIKYNIHNHIEWHDFYGFPEEEAFINDSIYIPAPIDMKIMLDCFQLANYYNYYYRQHGIPSAMDFVPYWGHINLRHYWGAAIDGIFVYNTKGWFTNTLMPKVYRMTYSHHPIITDGKNYVPELFRNPFLKDVSKDYITVTDAKIKLDFSNIHSRPGYAYLSVFNCKDLHALSVCKVKGRYATFKDIGKRIVYYPVCYEGHERKSLGFPFYIDTNEKLHYFIPDHAQLQTHKIHRKYLTEAQKIFWSTNMLGAIVVGANKSDFSDRQLILKISDHNEHLKTLKIPVKNKYRYIRFIPRKDSVYLSVLRLHNKDGQIFPDRIISSTDDPMTIKNLYDPDVLTYHLCKGELTFDLGKPQEIDFMEIAPRTDDNDIVVGEMYELFYYDLNGWNSLGRRVADTDYLEYSDMPKGAIFWLRNLTKGVEERVFSIDPNGQQRFW